LNSHTIKHRNSTTNQKNKGKKVSPRFSIFATPKDMGVKPPTKAAKLPSAVFTCGTSKRRSELLPREEVPRETNPWGNHGAMGADGWFLWDG